MCEGSLAFSPPALSSDAAAPSPPAQGCSATAGLALRHPVQGLGRSLHRTGAVSWWPLSCLPHSLQKSSLPGPDAQYEVPGIQCQPLQTWGRGLSGSFQGGGVPPYLTRPPPVNCGGYNLEDGGGQEGNPHGVHPRPGEDRSHGVPARWRLGTCMRLGVLTGGPC